MSARSTARAPTERTIGDTDRTLRRDAFSADPVGLRGLRRARYQAACPLNLILVEWHGYGRAYPPGRRQIVGCVFHLSDSERYRRLNDVVCVCVGEVRAPGRLHRRVHPY